MQDHIEAIIPDEEKRRLASDVENRKKTATRSAFSVWWWYEEAVDEEHTFSTHAVETRHQRKLKNETKQKSDLFIQPNFVTPPLAPSRTSNEGPSIAPSSLEDQWTLPDPSLDQHHSLKDLGMEEEVLRPHLLVSLSHQERETWILAYQTDPYYDDKGKNLEGASVPLTPSRFQRSDNGMIYFVDADWRYRLCVPRNKINEVLNRIHNSPHEGAHSGEKRFIARLRELFYWLRLAKDATDFVASCDVCQKTKIDRRGKQGGLRPSHIPQRPFATVSMDMITGLPESGKERFTAVLAFVDKLTKFAILIPTFNSLDQVGFALHFITHIVNTFGLPTRIICDRDKRWTSSFWRSVAAYYGSHLVLSSAHHPQTDGQTEILNAQIETMLRAYVAKDRSSWAQWLGVLARSYNSSVHSSTGYRPDYLLFGYETQVDATGLVPDSQFVQRPLASQRAQNFVAEMQHHRQLARDALTLAQERQAKAYNRNRRPEDRIEPGDFVLVNPHTLQLIEASGTGRKLVQRLIGPFEVLERINPLVYRLRLPTNYPMHSVVNICHLKRYTTSDPRFGPRETLPSTRDMLPATEEWEVDRILGHRTTSTRQGRSRQYLVRWKGLDAAEDSWLSEFDLRNAPELKRDYDALVSRRPR